MFGCTECVKNRLVTVCIAKAISGHQCLHYKASALTFSTTADVYLIRGMLRTFGFSAILPLSYQNGKLHLEKSFLKTTCYSVDKKAHVSSLFVMISEQASEIHQDCMIFLLEAFLEDYCHRFSKKAFLQYFMLLPSLPPPFAKRLRGLLGVHRLLFGNHWSIGRSYKQINEFFHIVDILVHSKKTGYLNNEKGTNSEPSSLDTSWKKYGQFFSFT